jgi:hypothetical protein
MNATLVSKDLSKSKSGKRLGVYIQEAKTKYVKEKPEKMHILWGLW